MTCYSNFLGSNSGYGVINAKLSNFFGVLACTAATNANNSNFLGNSVGTFAASASFSNFLGNRTGYGATNANYSNFLGQNAGSNATSASYSTLIGYQAGYNVVGGTLGIKSNNIIIGTNITLEHGRKDSINLGAIIFATGSYSDATQFYPFSGSAMGKVGINQPNPDYNLDISGSGNFTRNLTTSGSLVVTGSLEMTLQTGTPGNSSTPAGFYQGTLNGVVVYLPYYS